MTNLLCITAAPGCLLRVDLDEDGITQLYVNDGSRDAAIPLDDDARMRLAFALAPHPPILLPDGKWSPEAYAAIEAIRAALCRLDEHKDPHEQFAIREWVRTHVGRRAA